MRAASRWARLGTLAGLMTAAALLATGCLGRSDPASTGVTTASSSAAQVSSSAQADPASTSSTTATTTSSTTSSATSATGTQAAGADAMPKTGFGDTGAIALAVVVVGAGLTAISWRRWHATAR